MLILSCHYQEWLPFFGVKPSGHCAYVCAMADEFVDTQIGVSFVSPFCFVLAVFVDTDWGVYLI